MADVEPGRTPQHGLTAIAAPAEVATEVAAFLRQRFPQRRFDVVLSQGQILIQDVTVPAQDLSRHVAPATGEAAATPTALDETYQDCATCITAFLQQHSTEGQDCYTPVTTFLAAFSQWRTAAGQRPFSEEEILATLMEYWSVYQGAREGWILDEYTVTYHG